MYSAVKINGQPLYKLAREGKTVERKARPIEILDIRYEGSPAENEYALTVKCSKGTYIRVLLEEIAEAMGQKGTMSACAAWPPGCIPKPMPTRWKRSRRQRTRGRRPCRL